MNKYVCMQGVPLHGPYRRIMSEEYDGLVATAKSRASVTPDYGFKGRWDGDEGFYLEQRHIPGIAGEWYLRDLLPEAQAHANELDRHDLVWKGQLIEVKTFGRRNSWCNFYQRDQGKFFDWLYAFMYDPDNQTVVCCGYIDREKLMVDENLSDQLPKYVEGTRTTTTGWRVPLIELIPHGTGPLFV